MEVPAALEPLATEPEAVAAFCAEEYSPCIALMDWFREFNSVRSGAGVSRIGAGVPLEENTEAETRACSLAALAAAMRSRSNWARTCNALIEVSMKERMFMRAAAELKSMPCRRPVRSFSMYTIQASSLPVSIPADCNRANSPATFDVNAA